MAEPKRRGRPPKIKTVDVTPVEEPGPTIVQMQSAPAPFVDEQVQSPEIDAILDIKMQLPRHGTTDVRFTIKNVIGELTGSQRSPEAFTQILRDLLKSRFPKVE